MTIPDGYQLISPEPERADDMLHVAEFGFAFTVASQDSSFFSTVVPFGRARAIETTEATHGRVGTLAAIHISFPFATRVPGGSTVPASGLSFVAVHPGHRRRGLLREMIADHFSRSLARGEVISTLFAAEAAIYQRFGYGLAAPAMRLELDRGATLREVPGSDALTVTIDSADIARHGEVVRAVQAKMDRPGTATTLLDESLTDIFLDLESDRHGLEELRIAVVSDGETPVAYALFQRQQRNEAMGVAGRVDVRAWAALDARASRRLWSVLTDIDLMSSTHASSFAPDDPLIHLLNDARGAKMRSYDNLWLRILDLKAALEGRGWSADCDITLNIQDDQLPDNAGTWHIRAANGAANVARTSSDADISLSIQELSAAYLGGPTLTALARASLVSEHRPGAVGELSRALVGDMAPVANFNF